MSPASTPPGGTPPTRGVPSWRRYLRFWGPQVADDVEDELEFHLEMRVRDFVARGMSEDDARRAARVRLGNIDRARRACLAIGHRRTHRMLRTQLIDAVRQDVTFAVRTLARRAGWTPVVVLTLAVGIGANTAVFSIVDHVLLRPMAYPGADRLIMAMLEMKPPRTLTVNPGPAMIDVWRDARTLDAMEGVGGSEVTHQLPDRAPEVLAAARVTTTFPAFAGVRPILGRGFDSSDVTPGAELVVLLSESTWRSRFGGDRDVIGTRMTLDGRSRTVIGVYPSRLRLPATIQERTDVWIPADLRAPASGIDYAIGRRREGVGFAAIEAELTGLLGRLQDQEDARIWNVRVHAPGEQVEFRGSLWMFGVAVALVLLIACANVAHLLLAQGTARERELAVRRALGAGRLRLTRLLVTETLVLATLGCIAGALVAWGGLELLVATRPPGLSDLAGASLNGRALAVAAGLSVLTGIGFGIVSSAHALRRPAHEVLKASGTSLSGSRRQQRLRGALVVSEIAISAMLLVGASMLLRTVWNLQHLDPGYDPVGVYAARVSVPFTRYPWPHGATAFYDQLVERARTISGVERATIANNTPPGHGVIFGVLEAEDRPLETRPPATLIPINYVRPDYFSVLGMRFIEGGTIRDTSVAASEIVINEAAARTLWPDGPAVGRRFRHSVGRGWRWFRVAGVVGNDASASAPGEAPLPMLFFAEASVPASLVVRVRPGTDPVADIRRLIVSMDPLLPAARITSLEADLARQIARPRFTMTLLVVFATIAVLLSAVGLYAVMAYAVAQRTREIGIRVALGATRGRISRSVVMHGLRWTGLGLMVGSAAAYGGTRLIESMLFGVEPTDAMSFIVGGTMLILIAVAACAIPARRAARVDPVIAMRAE